MKETLQTRKKLSVHRDRNLFRKSRRKHLAIKNCGVTDLLVDIEGVSTPLAPGATFISKTPSKHTHVRRDCRKIGEIIVIEEYSPNECVVCGDDIHLKLQGGRKTCSYKCQMKNYKNNFKAWWKKNREKMKIYRKEYDLRRKVKIWQ